MKNFTGAKQKHRHGTSTPSLKCDIQATIVDELLTTLDDGGRS